MQLDSNTLSVTGVINVSSQFIDCYSDFVRKTFRSFTVINCINLLLYSLSSSGFSVFSYLIIIKLFSHVFF